jgi:oxygen-independent coproporphyrinogen-3 oxidase
VAGIYIHIPFCKQACYYCDFHFSTSIKRKNELVEALCTELFLRKNEFSNETVETIYFGGGTPSLLSEAELTAIFTVIYKNFKIKPDAEITLEANPDDLSLNKIKELAKMPVNRLSIGIQSFFDDDLRFMNRAHTAAESKKCLEIALKYFDNISIDLIYGIPKMTLKKWQANLEQTYQFNIPHISSYALTVEEKTALHHFIKNKKVKAPNENEALKHFNYLVNSTRDKGYIHYEISNFALPDFFSKHNTSYWQGKKYLGIGPSAHSFNGVQRCWNIANNAKYIAALKQQKLPFEIENLTLNNRFNERIMTGLRTIWGVSFSDIENEFGARYAELLKKNARPYIEKELLEIHPQTFGSPALVVTDKGKFLIDGIASTLFII